MNTPLAWRNVALNKVRSAIALCGISFVILLIFMQLGFYAAAGISASNIYETLDFDVAVVSRQYIFVARPAPFPRRRIEQLRSVEGVESVAPLWIGLGNWRSLATGKRWHILTLGVDPSQRPFRDASMNDQLPLLKVRDTALSDSLSRAEYDPILPGTESEIEHHRVRILGRYAIGAGFMAGATLVTGRETFLEIFKNASPEEISVGLVKLAPGASSEAVVTEMNRRLQPAAIAITRAELCAAEERYWLKEKPVGIMFTSGVLVAFVAGAVVLYQVLASEVQNRLREYATLKALGYGSGYVYCAVARQALIFSGLGFLPAFLLALGLYFLLRTYALVPVTMNFGRVAGVGLLTAIMGASATFLAVRKLRAADPADLF